MDDTARTAIDYDDWVDDPGNLASHVGGILARLSGVSAQEARQASERRRWPYLVNMATGHLEGHDLCWVCAVAIVHHGPRLPRLRGCRSCLAVDRGYAARLGLRHLLPMFEWPAPPVIDAALAGAMDVRAREAISRAWSEVSVLDRWRRDRVLLARAWMEVPDGWRVDLYDWQVNAATLPGRWPAGWEAYVEAHQPGLGRVLQDQATRVGAER